MKKKTQLLMVAAMSFLMGGQTLMAQLNIPSDGSDGALIITSNTVIDLSQAVTGTWSDNNSAHAGKGIYDPNKWAVVFKYSSVNIGSNATITFKNHPTHAPVVWLVNGDVTINGEVSLDGQGYSTNVGVLPEPGPGGFRGGGMLIADYGYGGGFGPGGYYNDDGHYNDPLGYGNSQIVPLIGGSGGGSWNYYGTSSNGGTGGGAILIAAAGTITINGAIHANGGAGSYSYSGSGGAIRLVAEQILGSGSLYAYGGPAGHGTGGSAGRIRLEADTTSSTLNLDPTTVPVSPLPLTIWPPANAPTVRVVSVAGQAAPSDPHADLNSGGDDLTLAKTNAVAIMLQTSNFPTTGSVNVYIKPFHAAQSILQASFVSGDANLATWQVNTTLPVNDHTVIQARAVAN